MPIPEAPVGPGAVSAVIALFRQVHVQLRTELDGLDDIALNWLPAPGANSIATIVTHVVGSEAETLRCVAGIACERDRESEFAGQRRTMIGLLGLLDRADHLITELEPLIHPDRLIAKIHLTTLPAEELRPGLTWLIGNYGHAREHVGHIQLTKELWQSQPTAS